MFGKTKKRIRDMRTMIGYKQKLEQERKIYTQTAEAYSDTDRKSRCLAVGECCIRILEEIGKMNLEHKLIPGTLEYMIDQQKVKDDTGKKGFVYHVAYQVRADEPAFTAEQIRERVQELGKQLKAETEELFSEQDEDGEENN